MPGRVNLIGEHIDYLGLPVLPMALARSVEMAFRPRGDGLVRIVNANPDFGPRSFALDREIPPDSRGDWANYLRAGAQGAVRRLGLSTGIDGVVASSLPVASGLSSSSALVIATALALMEAEGRTGELDALELASVMARAERYTGTQGGGMDQAICLGAREGHAALVSFDPLDLRHLPVPEDWVFLVVDSGERAEKSGAAQAAYNARTRQCAEGLAELRAHLGLPRGTTFRDLFPWTRSGGGGEKAAGEAAGRGMTTFLDPEELLYGTQRWLDPLLAARLTHVISETVRVRDAVEAMERADAIAFGDLMSASHESLSSDFQVSTRELDDIVEAAHRAGALGARLTGAGFGGCAVVLTDPAAEGGVLRALSERWTAFRVRPGSGAVVLGGGADLDQDGPRGGSPAGG